MFVEIGHFALILALCTAFIQALSPFLYPQTDAFSPHRLTLGARAAFLQFLLIALSALALVSAFVQSDFSVAVVYANSHRDTPLLYKITGLWGNHEGSMILWLLLFAGFSMLAGQSRQTKDSDELHARALSVTGWISSSFLLYVLFLSNPFARLTPPPLAGRELNPILQDIGLAMHPPLLYTGYVGFSLGFAFACAALIAKKPSHHWAIYARFWVLIAWIALSIGIALGSWWAYYELGWGGWWFWDPVENASLMPWLSGTALLHCLIVVERRQNMQLWALFLAIITFLLSLMGAFLVRSGILTSVHSFASDPSRGLFILLIFALAAVIPLSLFARHAKNVKDRGDFAPLSRETALAANNLFLLTCCACVLIGTLYPLFTEMLGYQISVGPQYFNPVFTILALPLLLILPIGPILAWRQDHGKAVKRLVPALVLALGAILLVLINAGSLAKLSDFLPVAGIGLGVWLIAGAICERVKNRRFIAASLFAWSKTLAHGGVGVMVIGITGISSWQVEKIIQINPGDSFMLGSYQLQFNSITSQQGANYIAEIAEFSLHKHGKTIGLLRPENRFFPVARTRTTEAAITSNGLRDIYLALGEKQQEGGYVIRAWLNPLVRWIWGGVGLMALGGMLSVGGILSARKKQFYPKIPIKIPVAKPAAAQNAP